MVTGLLRRAGSIGRRLAWNFEFSRGATFSGRRSDIMLALVRKYGMGKDVVELACGDGSLAHSFDDGLFRSYRGFDVASEAIKRARQKAGPSQTFDVQAIEDWRPTSAFDLLVVEEAIYYLSKHEQERLLARAFSAAPDCKVLVVVHSAAKHQASVATCRANAVVLEEVSRGERLYLLLERAN